VANYLTADEITTRLQTAASTSGNARTYGTCPNPTPGDAAHGIPSSNVPYVRIHSPSSPVTPRVGVLITGGVHAREWAPPEALVSFIEKLLGTGGTNPAQYGPFTQTSWSKALPAPSTTPIIYPPFTIDAITVRNIFQNVDLYIAPLINPDGHRFSRSSPRDVNKWWRKNRRGVTAPCLDDNGVDQGVGVDINRNFDIAWEFTTLYDTAFATNYIGTAATTCPGGPGGKPTDHRDGETFRGATKMNEPEVMNLDWLQQQGIQVFVDVHSHGPDIVYPWGIALADQTADPTENIHRTSLDGTRNKTYAEFISDITLDHHVALGGMMQQGIRETQTLDSRIDLSKVPREQRFTGEYQVGQSGAAMYVTTGACDDYHFSRQVQVGPGPTFPETLKSPELFAFTIECGSLAQGSFWPHRDFEFPKIERELHAAIWGILRFISSPQFGTPTSWSLPPGP
jgi:hypothetical protein